MGVRADAEVALGVILFIGVLCVRAAPIAVLLYWNFMMLRYMFSAWTQSSFRRIDRALWPIFGSIPGVKHGYTSLKRFLYSFVAPEAKKNGTSRMCTIL